MTITKVEMKAVLAKMMEQYRLVAPVFNTVLDFLEVRNIEDIVMDDRIPYKSPKEFFFPRCEELFRFHEGELADSIQNSEVGTVIFGAKPCDLEALGIMAKIFSQGKYADPYVAAHFEKTLIIGLGCQQKKAGCFCERLNIDMNYSDKCDLFLFEQGGQGEQANDYIVTHISEKGFEKLGAYIPNISPCLSAKKLPTQESKGFGLPKDDLKAFETVGWQAIAETCQACALCTFICPSCHCFDFKDVEDGGGKACRYRIWDSCMFAKFTLHASGHNPRATKTERYRQRLLHKYVYIPQNIGEIACTGCGRCTRSCPAGMDIMKIVEGIAASLAH